MKWRVGELGLLVLKELHNTLKLNLKGWGSVPMIRFHPTDKPSHLKIDELKKTLPPVILLECWKEKVKKRKIVIISAHYDHLGIRAKEGVLDSIYNGANDDASGVTGILALAEHFKKVGNERTLVFAAFTAEEMGLVGSRHFGKGIEASKFVAGINLEMIGKTPSFGPNTAWLTGFERSDFGKIIQKNLVGTGYQLYPDPYKKFNLFFRSDNASLARLGVPSHTFSTSPIDTDKDYHQVSDEAETLDIAVITQTIQAVAVGTKSIISGEDTPTRVVLEERKNN